MAAQRVTGHLFTVKLITGGGMTYCVPLKQEVKAWIERADQRALPSVALQGGESDALEVVLTWIEAPGANAWEAITWAVATLEAGCPRFLDALALSITAEAHDPRPDYPIRDEDH